MNIKEKLSTLNKGEWLIISASNIDHMLTGTNLVAIKKNGTIRVRYTDGTIEERKDNLFLESQDIDSPSLFNLVGHVQAGRA